MSAYRIMPAFQRGTVSEVTMVRVSSQHLSFFLNHHVRHVHVISKQKILLPHYFGSHGRSLFSQAALSYRNTIPIPSRFRLVDQNACRIEASRYSKCFHLLFIRIWSSWVLLLSVFGRDKLLGDFCRRNLVQAKEFLEGFSTIDLVNGSILPLRER